MTTTPSPSYELNYNTKMMMSRWHLLGTLRMYQSESSLSHSTKALKWNTYQALEWLTLRRSADCKFLRKKPFQELNKLTTRKKKKSFHRSEAEIGSILIVNFAFSVPFYRIESEQEGRMLNVLFVFLYRMRRRWACELRRWDCVDEGQLVVDWEKFSTIITTPNSPTTIANGFVFTSQFC